TMVFTVLTGILYPLAMTGAAQAIFPHQANGSLITANGKVIGSEIIGQNFTKPEYFHPRPSAAGANGYDAANTSGSNLGPTNPALADRLTKGAAQFRQENPDYTGPIPADAITTSASGIDPDISPANALAQVPRVAKARGMQADAVEQIVRAHIQSRTLGILGEPIVNVLKLNLALDRKP
ncbi:MAG TPA: potassium-transporting ATPase subunit KdpC, partial [Bryobacteraceae bacterium]|nr:potassium-transporting ATPase subunit KdpC [Bryobacteraceae bacterium]